MSDWCSKACPFFSRLFLCKMTALSCFIALIPIAWCHLDCIKPSLWLEMLIYSYSPYQLLLFWSKPLVIFSSVSMHSIHSIPSISLFRVSPIINISLYNAGFNSKRDFDSKKYIIFRETGTVFRAWLFLLMRRSWPSAWAAIDRKSSDDKENVAGCEQNPSLGKLSTRVLSIRYCHIHVCM